MKPTNPDFHRLICRDPDTCGGEPVLVGTRIPLRTVLACLAAGDTIPDILADFPTLREDQIRGVIAFAAASAEEDIPLPHPVPAL